MQGLAARTGRLKPREERLNVVMRARIRVGASWNDACILNLSTRGMLVRASTALDRGSYLEIRQGGHVIVARVIWRRADRFGVQTQDPIPAAALIRGTGPSVAPTIARPGAAERRAAIRPAAPTAEASRQRARAAQFWMATVVGGIAAILALGAMGDLLGRPLKAVGTVLAN